MTLSENTLKHDAGGHLSGLTQQTGVGLRDPRRKIVRTGTSIRFPNKVLNFVWAYVFIGSFILFIPLLDNSVVNFALFPLNLFYVPIINVVCCYPFLFPLITLTLLLLGGYSYLLLFKKEFELKLSIGWRLVTLILLVLTAFLTYIASFIFIIPSLIYPSLSTVKDQFTNYVHQHQRQVSNIFQKQFEQAYDCDPNMTTDQSIYTDKLSIMGDKKEYLQCLQLVAKKINRFTPNIDQLDYGRSLVFVKLKNNTTLQVLGLNGKLFEIKRYDPKYNNLEYGRNIEKLFLILQGKKDSQPSSLEPFKNALHEKQKSGHFPYKGIEGGGNHYLGYGEQEVVVPVKNEADKILGVILVIYGD